MDGFRRRFGERYQHSDIVVQMKHAYRMGAEWMLEYFEEQIRNGVVFRPGETVQIGWAVVRLNTADHDSLEIFEPDFCSMPVKWIRGANHTYRHVMLQREVCEQVGAEPLFPSMLQAGVVSPDFLKARREFHMSRDEVRANDSGWLCREEDYRGAEGRFCSLYEIACSVPGVIPFLALPPGSIVQRRPLGLEVSTNASMISATENDFLKRLLASAYLSRPLES